MKTLDVKAIRVPAEFAYQPGIFSKRDAIEKWVEEDVYKKTLEDDLVAFRIGDKPREVRVFVSVLNNESFMVTGATGKAVLISRKNTFGRDIYWGIYNAIQTTLHNDFLVIVLRKLIQLHNDEIAPIEKAKETNAIVGELAQKGPKPIDKNLFKKKPKKKTVKKKSPSRKK